MLLSVFYIIQETVYCQKGELVKIIAAATEIESLTEPLSSRFGKAKYYAFFNGNEMQIEENPARSGPKVVAWLIEKGVTDLLMKEVGRKPCALKPKHTISLHYPTTPHPTLEELVRTYYRLK